MHLLHGSFWLCCLFFLASCQTANQEKVASAEPVENVESPTPTPQETNADLKEQTDEFLIEYPLSLIHISSPRD